MRRSPRARAAVWLLCLWLPALVSSGSTPCPGYQTTGIHSQARGPRCCIYQVQRLTHLGAGWSAGGGAGYIDGASSCQLVASTLYGDSSLPLNTSITASASICGQNCSSITNGTGCNLFNWCSNPWGCCQQPQGCQYTSQLAPFGTCILRLQKNLVRPELKTGEHAYAIGANMCIFFATHVFVQKQLPCSFKSDSLLACRQCQAWTPISTQTLPQPFCTQALRHSSGTRHNSVQLALSAQRTHSHQVCSWEGVIKFAMAATAQLTLLHVQSCSSSQQADGASEYHWKSAQNKLSDAQAYAATSPRRTTTTTAALRRLGSALSWGLTYLRRATTTSA